MRNFVQVSRAAALLAVLLFGIVLPGFPVTTGSNHYALILSDPPVARMAQAHGGIGSAAAMNHRRGLEAAQSSLRRELAGRQLRVTGAAQTVLNAVFVEAPKGRETELRSLPGVKAVIRLRRVRPLLDRAVQIVNANPTAWNAVGGVANAGKGVKIGIIDTGIDQTHPAFNPAGFTLPSGFPKSGSDSAYTTNKVIVARSYINVGTVDPTQSHPDDPSPRDHVGHGTAVAMAAAGETNTGPADTITGMAPRAWLGNYKVFGSTYNFFTTDDAIIMAIDDAVSDGMDVINLSLGGVAFTGPLDQGAACGNPDGVACDPEVAAIEAAVAANVTVVCAAGNEGEDGNDVTGNFVVSYNTIDSPGYSPSAIAVGATFNTHEFLNRVTVPSGPSDLQQIDGVFGDGPLPSKPLTAPAIDVAKFGDGGLACTGLPAASLNGAIALVQRGTCTFLEKVNALQTAGALGAIILQNAGDDSLFVADGLSGTTIPVILIGSTDGQNLKSFVDSNPNHAVTIDTSLVKVDVAGNSIADFTSEGPVTGTGALKPDLVAVGTDLYLATERSDSSGELYSASGYTVSQGTSFSTPLVTGGAALVKQKNPGFAALDVKSAVVNTANTTLITDDSGQIARVAAMGAGLLDAGAAVTTNVTVQPSAVSFGILGSAGVQTGVFPISVPLTIVNKSGGSLNLSYSVAARDADANAHVTLDHATVTLASGQTDTLNVSLGGSFPSAGSYEGVVNINGGSVTVHVPYLYLVGDGVPATIIPLLGWDDDGTVNQDVPDGALVFKLIDQFGVPVSGVPVSFAATQGGGRIGPDPDSQTDVNGLAGAEAIYGSTPGDQEFTGQAGGLTVFFEDSARLLPVIAPNGAVNAADFKVGQGVAPGSYIALYGTGLSDTTDTANSASLPLSIDLASVSFDSGGISVPGHLYYVSPGQINVQVPWEMQGQTTAIIKVNISETTGQTYNLPIAAYSPAMFPYGPFAAAEDVSGNVITASHPVQSGGVVVLFANGLGPVTNQPASGEPAPSYPLLAETTTTPVVMIGGVQGEVQFSGLTPGISGLYQLNVSVPSGIGARSLPVTITIGGVTSPALNLPVE